VLVLGQERDAVDVADRDDRFRETAFLPGLRRALLRFDRIGVDVVAGEAVFRRDEIGRDALRHEVGFDRDMRIDRPGAAGCAEADAAHRLDAAADRHVLLAGHHLSRREVHGVESRGAEAVDLHAGDMVAVVGDERRRAGNVAAGLADRIDAAEDDVVDLPGVEAVALADRTQRRLGKPQRRHLVQRAVLLAAAPRGADVVVDESVGHLFLPSSRAREARPGIFVRIGRLSGKRSRIAAAPRPG
jgi:hypothetical protein